MSKKLFAALSLSVLLVACQGNVAVTDDAAMEAAINAEIDAAINEAAVDAEAEVMMDEGSSASDDTTVEMDVNAEAEVVAE